VHIEADVVQRIVGRSLDQGIKLFLAGDVMTGRGIDQVLPHPGDPELRELYVASARGYVALAESASGAIDAPLRFAEVWGDGLRVLAERAPDARIVNLETSITAGREFWPGKAVHYRMHPANVACLRAAELDVCALANNHVLDFGARGLVDTVLALREAGIDTAGAGRSLAEARRPAVVMLGRDHRVLVVAVGSETSGCPPGWAAESSRPGIELLPDLSTPTAEALAARVGRHRRAGDLAVVSIHWGSNWGYEVAPEMVRFARALVDGGIDVVHGHSSHHIRPIEVYRGKLILYGAGDLITDYEGIEATGPYRGDLGAMFFPELSAHDGTLRRLCIVPTTMKRLRLRLAAPDDVAWLRATLSRISRPFESQFEQTSAQEIVLRGTGG
jgi:poly-gamma-glutamate capsule biosynthesis protein CapA/YwtB (metallophosphatase superfamily)